MDVQTGVMDGIDRLIMEASPFLQEVSIAALSGMLEEAVPSDMSGDAFRAISSHNLAKIMSIRVRLPNRKSSDDDSPRWESLHSLLVQLFKDRRAKLVRSCKTALDHVIELASAKVYLHDTATKADKEPKKRRCGGVVAKLKSKRSERHRSLGAAAAVSTSGRRVGEGPLLRVVQRGFPQTDDNEESGEVDDSTGDEWVVSLATMELSEFWSTYSFFEGKQVTELEWDCHEHPLFLPYYAAVCSEMDVRKPIPRHRIGPIDPVDGNTAPFRPLAVVSSNRHGAVIEVRGPCSRFEAFVASQVFCIPTSTSMLYM